MPVAQIVSAILVLLAFVMGLRHGVGLLRSSPAQVQETLHISLNQPTILIVGFLTCLGAILVIFRPAFFAANVISAAVILYLAAMQSKTHNLRGALVELPLCYCHCSCFILAIRSNTNLRSATHLPGDIDEA